MAHVLIVGAGAIGQASAQWLAAAGHEVLLLSRSGPPAPGPGAGRAGVPHLAFDLRAPGAAARLADLAGAAGGQAVVVNAVNPAYTRWPTDWPPLAATLLEAAERAGAGLVTVSNLYPYGRVDEPMVQGRADAPNGPKSSTRAAMWAQALAAHEAGRVRATELRASDYFGPIGSSAMSYLNRFVIRPASAGRTVRLVMGDPDAPHAWSYLPDLTRALAALAVADPAGPTWGHVWHAPTGPARSIRQVVADIGELTGSPPVPVRMLPGRGLLRRTIPALRELNETAHQFERPFVLDSTRTEAVLGVTPTPWPSALQETLRALGGRGTRELVRGTGRS